MLKDDQENFKNDLVFLLERVTLKNNMKIKEKGKKLLQLQNELGAPDKELKDLLESLDFNIQSIDFVNMDKDLKNSILPYLESTTTEVLLSSNSNITLKEF